MPLNAFRIDRLNSPYCQCLRCIPRSRIKIACLGISCGQRIDHVFILPRHETASGLGIFDRLSAIAKRRVWASLLKPRTVAQRPGKSNAPRMDRDEIIKLLQCFRVFSKARVDPGSQQGGLDKARVLPERHIAILNSKIVFALPCKNLRADVESRPKCGISVKRRVQVELCTRSIAMFQPIFSIRKEVDDRPSAFAVPDYDRYACVDSRHAGDHCNEE